MVNECSDEAGIWWDAYLLDGLIPTLSTVDGEVLHVVETAGGGRHHVVQRAIEAEVVTTSGEEIVTGERSVGLELVVTCKTWLAAGQKRSDGCAGCGLVAMSV